MRPDGMPGLIVHALAIILAFALALDQPKAR
jgi:hypothetical protein